MLPQIDYQSSGIVVGEVHFYEQNVLHFLIQDPVPCVPTRAEWEGEIPGAVRPHLRWETVQA
jgi:hypothetical protein